MYEETQISRDVVTRAPSSPHCSLVLDSKSLLSLSTASFLHKLAKKMTMRFYYCLMTLFMAPVFGQNAMTVSVPSSNNWEIGATLNSNFERKASPFTQETMKQFQDAWIARKERGDYDAAGTFKMTTRLVQSQEDKLEAIGVEGSLSLSYMMFSVCSWTFLMIAVDLKCI